MVLLPALLAGLLVGLGQARWRRIPFPTPDLAYLWLVFIAFLSQIFVSSLPNVPNGLAASFLLLSQILLFQFAWLNRRIPGMPILICGVLFNLLVMAANGGFMPISPHTAGQFVSAEHLLNIHLGSRIGAKDILLFSQDTRFEWLADRFLTPAWTAYRAAFSLGDVFIAFGAFWLLAKPVQTLQFMTTRGAQS